MKENKVLLTFSEFFAASAPDRLSKVTNPTGWKVKKQKQFEPICLLNTTAGHQTRIILWKQLVQCSEFQSELEEHISSTCLVLQQFFQAVEAISPVLTLT